MNNDFSPFVAVIDSMGTIFQYSSGRKGQAVGIDSQRTHEIEQEYSSQIADMQEVIDKLYQELVDAGLRIPKKTPEEVAQEQAEQQAEMNRSMLSILQEMQEEIKLLKTNQNQPGDARPKGRRQASEAIFC